MKKGSKYFTENSIEHAVELKFIKNQDLPSSKLEEGDWADFSRDLKKLKELKSAKSKHLVVFSNKNFFQQAQGDQWSTEKAHERYQKLEKKCEDLVIMLWEASPTKSQN